MTSLQYAITKEPRPRRGRVRIQDPIPDVQFEVDAQGCWSYLDPSWIELTGWSTETSLGRPCQESLSEKTLRRARLQFVQLTAGVRLSTRFDAEVRLKGGGSRWVEVFASRLSASDDRSVGVAGTLRDITARKQTEQRTRSACREAERASRAKSEFMAMLSHELRLSLRDLLGLSNVLLESTSGSALDTAAQVQQSMREILDLFNNLFDLARLDSGHLKLAQRPVDLRLATEDVIDAWTAKADRKHIDLVLEFSIDLPKRVLMDAARYRQVLSAFVEQAIDSMPKGCIRVSAEAAALSAAGVELLVRIEASGHGGKFSGAELMQSDYPLLPGRRSSTLGLTVAHRLLAAMNGALSTSRGEQDGTVVTLKLPFRRDPEEWPVPSPPIRVRGASILIAAESAAVRSALRSALAGTDVEIYEATTQAEANECLEIQARLLRPVRTVFITAELAGDDRQEIIRQNDYSAETAYVLLARSTEMPELAQTLRTGYQALLRRNPRRTHVLAVLHATMGDRPASSDSLMSGESRCSQSPDGLSALLVSADQPNLLSIAATLEQVGCRYHISNSAACSLAAVSREHFDVVLIDEALPDTNPLELTQRIVGRQPVRPSVVGLMTQNAEGGLTNSQAQEGITDLLQKPLEETRLQSLLAVVRKPAVAPVTFNYPTALRRCGNDLDLLTELVIDVREYVSPLLVALTHEIGRQQTERALSYARELVSAAELIGAERLCETAAQLTDNITLQDWADAASDLTTAKTEYGQLLAALLRANLGSLSLNGEKGRHDDQ